MTDLHLHSIFSDGTDDVDDLLVRLRNAGIFTFSLTDHDTVSGCKAIKPLVPDDMNFICGVELSCRTDVAKCHILGYGFNPEHEAIRQVLDEGMALRNSKMQVRLGYLHDRYGITFAEEELNTLCEKNSAGRYHLAEMLVVHGYSETIKDALERFINDCPTPNDRLDADKAISSIIASGGIPVWAHPLGGEGEKPLTGKLFEMQLRTLQAMGIQGLECYYSKYGRRETKLLVSEAENSRLLVSGGSDYHGKNKAVPIGRLSADGQEVDDSMITVLQKLM